MSDPTAKDVAEAIYAEAISGSAIWDEMNGPNTQLMEIAPERYIILVPAWSEALEDYDHASGVIITVRGATARAIVAAREAYKPHEGHTGFRADCADCVSERGYM